MKKLVLVSMSFLWLTLSLNAFSDVDNSVDMTIESEATKNKESKTDLEKLKILANQGDSEAQTQLGSIYYKGEGVLQDYQQAFHYYKLAAQQGNSRAQFDLGAMYGNGKGVLQDYLLAYVWSNIAASQGNEAVTTKLRDMATKKLTNEKILEAQAIAKKCLESDYQDCER